MDLGLVLGAFLGAFGYLVEIDSICLIDQFTGVREQLIQEALERENLKTIKKDWNDLSFDWSNTKTALFSGFIPKRLKYTRRTLNLLKLIYIY